MTAKADLLERLRRCLNNGHAWHVICFTHQEALALAAELQDEIAAHETFVQEGCERAKERRLAGANARMREANKSYLEALDAYSKAEAESL